MGTFLSAHEVFQLVWEIMAKIMRDSLIIRCADLDNGRSQPQYEGMDTERCLPNQAPREEEKA